MPIKTPHYSLDAFGWGDYYSSKHDQNRFEIIDNQMAFLSDRIGEGIITGWEIIEDEDGDLAASTGIGIIGKAVYYTFGASEIVITDNALNYVYMKARTENIGGVSSHSNIASIVAFNTIPPLSPSGIKQETSITIYLAGLNSYTSEFLAYLKRLLSHLEDTDDIEIEGYKEIAFSWNENTEEDFGYYKIYRIFGSDITLLGTTTETIYIDIDLEQNTEYTYHVVAVDLSGNESSAAEITISTDIDTRIPLPPIFVKAYPTNKSLQVVWDVSASDNVDHYTLVLQTLDDNYNVDGDSVSYTIENISDQPFVSTCAILSGLQNEINYRVTVYAISDAGYSSEGISVNTRLNYSSGAGEVNNIEVDFIISEFENVGIETNIEWRFLQESPSINPLEKFLITFVENGTRFSDPIEVLPSEAILDSCSDGSFTEGECYSLNIKYIPFVENGFLVYESLKEYTPYIIVVQTQDEDGDISGGFIYRVSRTPIITAVSAVEDLSLTRKTDNTLFIKWINPDNEYFSYNTITVGIIDLSASNLDPSAIEETIYLDGVKIGQVSNYSIPSSQFNVNYRYTITVVPHDVFGEAGNESQIIQQFTSTEGDILVPSPDNLIVSAGDGQVYLSWDRVAEEYDITYYKIYRAIHSFYLKSTDFEIIGIIPSTLNSFIDYTVENDISYDYFVTSIDVYERESLNPSYYGYISNYSFIAEPKAANDMTEPSNLIIQVGSGETDAELSWDVSTGAFDGYEILRSDGNNYSFQVIGYAFPGETVYFDSDALLQDGITYYYMIRKYQNETDIIVSTSSTSPYNSIFIGTINSVNNVITIDTSNVKNLYLFEDPVRDLTEEQVELHNHKYEEGIDRRIDLRSNSVITSWETLDYSIYTTTEDIEGASDYVVKVTGTINNEYFTDENGNVNVSGLSKAQIGESPVDYEIDIDNKTITFNEPLYTTCIPSNTYPVISCPVTPYSSFPSVSLELIEVSEVDSLLPDEKIESVSATQVKSGVISSNQMPQVHHSGRLNERMIPVKLPMQSLDNISYSLSESYEDEDRNKMGNSVTFYDIISTGQGDQLLAATSSGIWVSDNFGNDWEQRENFSVTVHRVFHGSNGSFYAVTITDIYINNGSSFRSWRKMGGLEYVKIIRDIDEDNEGNLYISTDVGVFRLNSEEVPYIEDSWEQLSIFGVRSTDAYALLIDNDYIDASVGETDRILSSNELGLLESINAGRSWRYISELEISVKIRDFIKYNNCIFALSDKKLFRQVEGGDIFEEVSSFSSSVISCRKIQIYNNKIYITTNDGVKVSTTSNIYDSNSIDFVSTWSAIDIHEQKVIVYSLNIIDGMLFIGTDRRLFLFDENEKLWIQYEQKNTIVPSIYVDDIVQTIGFYYNNKGAYHNISFDENIETNKEVKIVNKYNIYVAEYGGWAQNKYDAMFYVYKNGIQFGRAKSIILIDTAEFLGITIPDYDDLNAHKIKADEYQSNINANIVEISALTSSSGEEVVILIKNILDNIELFLSQVYTSVKSQFSYPKINAEIVKDFTIVSNMGETETNEVSVYYELNQQKGTNYSAYINVVDGTAIFDVPFDRYDNIRINVYGISVSNAGELSHRDLEDEMEYVNSGLPSYLSQVQQINIVKLGTFIEQTWAWQQDPLSTKYQMKNIIPRNDEWYDTLNSTANYTEIINNGSPFLSLLYPSSVLYVAETDEVFVGGRGGVISINVLTLDMKEIEFADIGTQMIRQIFRENDNIYILSEEGIYKSEDFGITWADFGRDGLSNHLYSIGAAGNNIIIGGEDGIYVKSSAVYDWKKTVSSSKVEVMLSSNYLFSVIEGSIQITSNGYSFIDTGLGKDLDILSMTRYNYFNTYISTKQGLYSDNGSFNSVSPYLTKIDIGAGMGVSDSINDVATDDANKTAVAISNGSYILIDNNIYKTKESTVLSVIHKILIINGEVWAFGNNVVHVPFLDYPIRLSTGAPL